MHFLNLTNNIFNLYLCGLVRKFLNLKFVYVYLIGYPMLLFIFRNEHIATSGLLTIEQLSIFVNDLTPTLFVGTTEFHSLI